MNLNGSLQTKTVSHRKRTLIRPEQTAVWVSAIIDGVEQIKKSFAFTWIPTPDRPDSSIITVLNTLPQKLVASNNTVPFHVIKSDNTIPY